MHSKERERERETDRGRDSETVRCEPNPSTTQLHDHTTPHRPMLIAAAHHSALPRV